MNWIADYIEGHGEEFWQRALKIHGYAELAGEERQSAAELCAMLEQAGFAVEQGLGSQPTAFRAVYGSGGPVIGFLCEYDALPKLNQTEGTCYNGDGRSGHGCGHNLLGVGAAAAAMALREEMEKGGLSGTLVVYGCPAEETLFGKTKMAEEGYFKELDVALAWHPEDHYCCGEVCHKAMDSIRFRFHGRSAHASVCPELGRSALDGAEMMSVGANYLREHVPDGVRIHYSYLSAGEKPNVVPDFAEVWYFVRSNRRRIVDQVTERLIQVARGAAMMSGTEVEWEFLARGKSTRINTTLAELAYGCMRRVPLPRWEEPELRLAAGLGESLGLPGTICGELTPPEGRELAGSGSTDFSAVSQTVPSVEINTVCFTRGTPGHHWAVTAQSCSPIGRKGMLYAAGVLAEMGKALLEDPGLLSRAREEYLARAE